MTKTSWGGEARWYDKVVRDDDSYQTKVIAPNILRIMAAKKGERILDLACGQGFFSHVLAAEGAFLTGVDIAPELIEIAKKHAAHNQEFYVTSATDLSILKTASFDKALCVLALQNIENLTATLKEVSRVLKPRGTFTIVLNHPAFRIPEKSTWQFDEKTDMQHRRIDAYMSESRSAIDMHPGETASGKKQSLTYSFHRPIQVYSKNLANAGFAISRIEEWMSHKQSENGPRKRAEDKARKEIPLFMCLECVKI